MNEVFRTCDGCPTPVECAVVQRCQHPVEILRDICCAWAEEIGGTVDHDAFDRMHDQMNIEPLDPLGGPLEPEDE